MEDKMATLDLLSEYYYYPVGIPPLSLESRPSSPRFFISQPWRKLKSG